MSEKKMSEGRRKWKMNTIALLKPLVLEGNHISRRIAVKLVKPTNDWERRQLDTLRGQANKIIRRENTDPLLYTVWGMSLEHPALAAAKKTVIKLSPNSLPFIMPERLDIRGMQESAEAVYRDGMGRPRKPQPGEVWVLRSGESYQLMFIEEGDTYVLSSSVESVNMSDITPGERFDCRGHIGLGRIDIVNLKASVEKASAVEGIEATIDKPINLMSKEEALSREILIAGDAYNDNGVLCVYGGAETGWMKLGIMANRNDPKIRALRPEYDVLGACGAMPTVRGKVTKVDDLPDYGEQGDLYYVEELHFEPVVHNGTWWVNCYPPFEVVKLRLKPKKGERRMHNCQVEFWDGTQWVLSLDEVETTQHAVMDPERQKKLSVWQRLKRAAGFK